MIHLNRTTHYYTPRADKASDLELAAHLDKEYMEHPEKGVLRMRDHLVALGCAIGLKRTRRLLRTMGLDAIYRKPNLSRLGKVKYLQPYLLKGLKVVRANQVWAIDITYIPMQRGHLYLTAIIDLYSRYIVGWGLHNTLDAANCVEVLNDAVSRFGSPKIINSDQGSQFTSAQWTQAVDGYGITASMDGRGRAIDNIFIERFWRTVKYEYIYIRSFDDGVALHRGLAGFMSYYNERRAHQSLGRRVTPAMRYKGVIGESSTKDLAS